LIRLRPRLRLPVIGNEQEDAAVERLRAAGGGKGNREAERAGRLRARGERAAAGEDECERGAQRQSRTMHRQLLRGDSHGFGLAKNHPYRDGNKRIGLLAIATFLGINGYDLRATDAAVVTQILTLADNRVSEAALADWIRTHSSKRK
jgi:hypothetical protein